jgi:hypothetical protein
LPSRIGIRLFVAGFDFAFYCPNVLGRAIMCQQEIRTKRMRDCAKPKAIFLPASEKSGAGLRRLLHFAQRFLPDGP